MSGHGYGRLRNVGATAFSSNHSQKKRNNIRNELFLLDVDMTNYLLTLSHVSLIWPKLVNAVLMLYVLCNFRLTR